MALADLYVLDFKQRFRLQDIHNIFTFDRSGTGNAVDLNSAFVNDLLTPINAIQNNAIENVSLRTYCLGDLADNGEFQLSGGGLDTSTDMLPLHDAVNFTIKSTTRAVRPGSKRFSGVSEPYQSDGDIIDSAYIAVLETLRLALGDPITGDASNIYDPVIVKRVKYTVPDSDPPRDAYRFPEIGETPVVGTVAAVLLNKHISTQVSRK